MDVQNKSDFDPDITDTLPNINTSAQSTISAAFSDEKTQEEPALVTEIATDWISLKDYANELGVSYEAVRQQVNKKQDELKGHIKNIGKTRFLDEEARQILSSKNTHSSHFAVKSSSSSLSENPLQDHKLSVVDIRRDMIDDRWTIDDYRNRIRQLEDEKRELESEYEMLKSLLASMNIAEFRSWKRQQKKEWNDKFLSKNYY